MECAYQNGKLTISDLKAFSLEQCLFSGQAFRWRPHDSGFSGIALGRQIYAEQQGETLTLSGVDEQSVPGFIRYFDIERDYAALQNEYAKDPFLREGISYASGLHVLRQPHFETLITFIISANNNVGRITRIVDALCKRFGAPIGDGFDFPTPEALACADEQALLACGTGYRASYIIGAARMVAQGFRLADVAQMPYEQARQALTALPGVGLKVADCVALYGLGFMQAFPYDVWIRRVLCGVYGFEGKTDKQMRDFVDSTFGAYAGIAQQYLFHYARHHKDAVCPK